MKSLSRFIHKKGCSKEIFVNERILKPIKTKYGYLVVSLYDKKHKVKQIFIHRLVAIAFLQNPYNFPFVNHKDENKCNNFVFINLDGSVNENKSNIEWCTAEYNVNYGNCIQKISDSQKKREVNVYKMDGTFVSKCESVTSASKKFNIPLGNVSGCLAKREGYAKGYVFRYVDDVDGNKPENIIISERHQRPNTCSRKRIGQYNKENEFLAEYISMTDAYRKTSVRRTSIWCCCNGRYKTAGGYIWKYI